MAAAATNAGENSAKMIAYLFEAKIPQDHHKRRKIAQTLLNDERKAGKYTSFNNQTSILDAICDYYFNQGSEDLLYDINHVLEICDLKEHQLAQLDVQRHLRSLYENTRPCIDLSNKSIIYDVRNRVTNAAVDESRCIAHFLITYEDYQELFADKWGKTGKEFLEEVLKRWLSRGHNVTWERLSSTLLFLGKTKLIEEIEDRYCPTGKKSKKERPLPETLGIILVHRSADQCVINVGNFDVQSIYMSSSNTKWKKVPIEIFSYNDLKFVRVKTKFKKGDFQFKIISKDNKEIKTINSNFGDYRTSHIINYKQLKLFCHSTGVEGNMHSSIIQIHKTPFASIDDFITYNVYIAGSELNAVHGRNEWENTICKDYMNRNFSLHEEIIRISLTCPLQQVDNVASHFMKWLDEDQQGGFVLTSYDALGHAKFLNIDINELFKYLKINCEIKFHNQLLVYIPKQQAIFNIFVADGSEIGDIYDSMKWCCDSIKLLSTIERDVLFSTDIVIVGLVVVPGEKVPESTFEKLCSSCHQYSLVVSEKEIVKTKWQNKIKKGIRLSRHNCDTVYNKEACTALASHILGYIAAEHFDLPTLSDDVTEQIKTVLLNREQLEINDSQENKIIVNGPFGSGKSILGQLKLKKLMANAVVPTRIFYLSYSSDTMYIHEMERHKNTMLNNINNSHVDVIVSTVADLKMNYQLTGGLLSVLVEHLYKSYSDQIVHIIIEEFNGEQLSETEAKRLNSITRDKKDYNVMIISHSMHKNMEYISLDEDRKVHLSVFHDAYRFDLLSDFCSFQLHRAVRNTTSVVTATQVFQDTVEKNPKEFFHPLNEKNSDPKMNVTENVKVEDIYKLPPCDNSTENNKASIEGRKSDDYEPASTELSMNRDSSNQTKAFQDPIEVDLAFIRLLQTENVSELEKTRISYKFHEKHSPGHNITGKLPTLTWIHLNQMKEMEYISVVLRHVWEEAMEKSHKLVFMCLNKSSCQALHEMMFLFGEKYICYTPSFNKDHKHSTGKNAFSQFKDLGNDKHLITDFKGYRGMENETVMLLLNEDDDAIEQYVVECVTRSLGDLYICYVEKKMERYPEASNMISQLFKDGLVKRKKVQICEDCEDENSAFTKDACLFHLHSRSVMDMHKKVSNLQRLVQEFDEFNDMMEIERRCIHPFLTVKKDKKKDKQGYKETDNLRPINTTDIPDFLCARCAFCGNLTSGSRQTLIGTIICRNCDMYFSEEKEIKLLISGKLGRN